MTTVDIKQLKAHLEWRLKTSAVTATQACEMLGIKRPTLTVWIHDGKIKGKLWDGCWWFPLAEVERHLAASDEVRVGRPRSGRAKPACS